MRIPLALALTLGIVFMRAEAGGDGHARQLFIERGSPEQPLLISGHFESYVACGSQLATWHAFPAGVRFSVEADAGAFRTTTPGLPDSISFHQSTIERYRQLPCDQLQRRTFSIDLAETHGIVLPENATDVTITAEYLGVRSNVLRL